MGSIFRDNLMSAHVAIAKKNEKFSKTPNIYCKIYLLRKIQKNAHTLERPLIQQVQMCTNICKNVQIFKKN